MNPEVEMAENRPSLSQRQKGNNLLGGTVVAKMASAGNVAYSLAQILRRRWRTKRTDGLDSGERREAGDCRGGRHLTTKVVIVLPHLVPQPIVHNSCLTR